MPIRSFHRFTPNNVPAYNQADSFSVYYWSYPLLVGIALQLVIFGALLRDPPPPDYREEITSPDQVSLFKDWAFILFLLNNFLFNFGSLIVFVLIVDYAEFVGMTTYHGVYLISILGISNAAGRGLVAIFGMCDCNSLILYLVTCVVSGVAICLVNLPIEGVTNRFYLVAVCCAVYGLFCGIQLANLAIVTSSLVSTRQLNTAYGVTMLMNGAGAATGPPFAGKYT